MAVSFSIIAAQAQTVTRYKAQIPFDFKIGQKNYQAGEYHVAINNSSSIADWLLENAAGHSLPIMSVLMNE